MRSIRWYDDDDAPSTDIFPPCLKSPWCCNTRQVCCFARLLERTGRAGDGFDDIRDRDWDAEEVGEYEGLYVSPHTYPTAL